MKEERIQKENPVREKPSGFASEAGHGLVYYGDRFRGLTDDEPASPDEYAQEQIRSGAEEAAYGVGRFSQNAAGTAYRGIQRQTEIIRQRQPIRFQRYHGEAMRRSVQSEAAAEKVVRKAQKAAKSGEKVAERSAKAARKAAESASEAAKKAGKALVTAIRYLSEKMKSLGVILAAGGWIAVLVIVIVAVLAMIVGSCFGIFYGEDDSGDLSVQNVIRETEREYLEKLEETKAGFTFDLLEIREDGAGWGEILAVYAVKTSMDPERPKEIVTMDEETSEMLKTIFWDLHEISAEAASETVMQYTETQDPNGRVVVTEAQVPCVVLHLAVTCPGIEEIKARYDFSVEQMMLLDDLLSEKRTDLWKRTLGSFGIS